MLVDGYFAQLESIIDACGSIRASVVHKDKRLCEQRRYGRYLSASHRPPEDLRKDQEIADPTS